MSLYENINKRKKAGTSRSKKNSTISPEAYANMQKGFPKKMYGGGVKKKMYGGGMASSNMGQPTPMLDTMSMTPMNQRVKSTMADGGSVPANRKGFSKLPESVQKKISPSMADKYGHGGKVYCKGGGTRKVKA
jgi:hypothetical protein